MSKGNSISIICLLTLSQLCAATADAVQRAEGSIGFPGHWVAKTGVGIKAIERGGLR